MDRSPWHPHPLRPRRINLPWRAFARTLGAGALIAAGLTVGCAQLASRLTVNFTTSMPRGLYWLGPTRPLTRGTIVSLPVPVDVRALVAERHYLPSNFHLLKRVVALPGDRVCIEGHRYVVGDQLLSPIAERDQGGRPLTPYLFCSTVPPGTAFVAASGASSLDSRYFGPVSLNDLTPAVPLWTSY
jgi:conjugative transfer signal peptidase TraF